MNDKQQLAAMGEHLAEQRKPMCMEKRIEELEVQVRVMAESLREAISVLSSINHGGEHEVHIEGDEPAFWQRGEWVEWAKSDVLPKLQAALAGKLPEHVMQEGWQMVPVEPTERMISESIDAGRFDEDDAVFFWASMLAAAPSPDSAK